MYAAPSQETLGTQEGSEVDCLSRLAPELDA